MSMKKIAAKMEKKQLLDVLNILENLVGDGKEVIDKEEMIQILQQREQELLEEINYLKEKESSLEGGVYDSSLFDRDILCENSRIVLRKAVEDDRKPYYQLKYEYAYMKSAFSKPEYEEELWQEYISEESLFYTIERKEDHAFIGYCGVKSLKRKVWEIAIEMNSDCCQKGYGYEALKMYLETVARISNRHEFSSRVDADNIASQKLMEKLGFQPYGLSEFLLHREEEQLAVEEEYKDQLDERYLALAEKFHVEPRKLLSHVLEYRIVV